MAYRLLKIGWRKNVFKKDQTAQTLKDFEQQKYPEDLDKQLKQIQSDYDRDFNDLSVSIDRIKAAADKAAAASGSIGDMKTDIQRLSQDTEALKTKLADVRAKVSTFGQKAGGAIAAAAYKAFTGGIA